MAYGDHIALHSQTLIFTVLRLTECPALICIFVGLVLKRLQQQGKADVTLSNQKHILASGNMCGICTLYFLLEIHQEQEQACSSNHYFHSMLERMQLSLFLLFKTKPKIMSIAECLLCFSFMLQIEKDHIHCFKVA